MIIRVRSPEGMHRVEVGLSDTLGELLRKLAVEMKAPAADAIVLTRDVRGQELLAEFEQSVVSLGLKHGDMLFASVAPSARPSEEPAAEAAAPEAARQSAMQVQQHAVDNELERDDGLIRRERDRRMCKHGANAMCEYCTPTEPYDAAYLQTHGIKHMSFQAYLRRVLADHSIRGDISGALPTNMALPLDEPEYRVKAACVGSHAPWPAGICSKCQPSAITLQRQPFRMVDNVEFASPDVVDRLLAFWRASRCQRLGFLYGRYQRLRSVPLGVSALVEAVYEPRQSRDQDGVHIDVGSAELDAELARADAVAAACGMELVGMVFTDLTPAEPAGKVLSRRHADSYFLTSLECRLAAFMQDRRPNACRWARGGRFGSKFVTCCVSGNLSGDIEVSAWQVSNSAMAMQRADLAVPSSAPSKMCVQEPSPTRYVPDVFYRYTNEYNLPVTASAKPAFPVEYLLVSLTQSFPLAPAPAFRSDTPFAIENREHVHAVQSLGALKRHLAPAQGSSERLSVLLADFHLLVYLFGLGILGEHEVALIGRIVCEPMEAAQLAEELMAAGGWQTLVLMLQEASDSDLDAQHSAAGSDAAAAANPAPPAPPSATWACRHCTFENAAANASCEMCALPRD
ncbi:nuclear protein localization protein 4 [Coemansia sp. Cherry 401B]|nr:nuclear protein localization protein 4 [Coemansia sp. Cherry 401B]